MGNLEEGLSTGDFERRMKGALGTELLSLKRLCGGGLEVELLHWEPWKICSDSLWIWASLSIGAHIVLRVTWCLGGRLVYWGL